MHKYVIGVLILLVIYLMLAEPYGICKGCGPTRPYTMNVLNPFAYPFSGSSDLDFLSKQENLEPPIIFPSKVPTLIPDIPLTHMRSPDHVLLVGYDGGGYY
jgi:hypothetical protein